MNETHERRRPGPRIDFPRDRSVATPAMLARQRAVLLARAMGLPLSTIAAAGGYDPMTISRASTALCDRLGAVNITHALARAVITGEVSRAELAAWERMMTAQAG